MSVLMNDEIKFWFIIALISFVICTLIVILTIKLMINSFNKIGNDKTDK